MGVEMISVNTNVTASMLSKRVASSSKSLESDYQKISLGKRIVSSKDDAASVSSVVKISSSINGSTVAQRNIKDAINKLNKIDAMLESVVDVFQSMREIAIDNGNIHNDPAYDDAGNLLTQEEHTRRGRAMQDYEAYLKKFMDTKDIDGSYLLNPGVTFEFQIGSEQNDTLSFDLGDMSFSTLRANNNVATGFYYSWISRDSKRAVANFDSTITEITTKRAEIGATVNALNHNYNALSVGTENKAQAVSRIQDTDMAYQTSQLAKNQILQQASMSALKQANSSPEIALQLLGGAR